MNIVARPNENGANTAIGSRYSGSSNVQWLDAEGFTSGDCEGVK